MSDTKLLQVILDKVTTVDKKVDEVKEEVRDTREDLTTRIDKLGLQIAGLEDDFPTVDEFDKLEKKVSELEDHTPRIEMCRG